MNPFVVTRMVSLLFPIAWFALLMIALWQLRRATLSESVRLGWAALIVLIPIIGAVAFFIVRPGGRK